MAGVGQTKDKQSLDMKEFNALNEKVKNGESNDIEEQRLDDLAPAYVKKLVKDFNHSCEE